MLKAEFRHHLVTHLSKTKCFGTNQRPSSNRSIHLCFALNFRPLKIIGESNCWHFVDLLCICCRCCRRHQTVFDFLNPQDMMSWAGWLKTWIEMEHLQMCIEVHGTPQNPPVFARLLRKGRGKDWQCGWWIKVMWCVLGDWHIAYLCLFKVRIARIFWDVRSHLPCELGETQGSFKEDTTVDGPEIRRSPVEVGSLSHYLQLFYTSHLLRISSIDSRDPLMTSKMPACQAPKKIEGSRQTWVVLPTCSADKR